jgi:hypothetical protein
LSVKEIIKRIKEEIEAKGLDINMGDSMLRRSQINANEKSLVPEMEFGSNSVVYDSNIVTASFTNIVENNKSNDPNLNSNNQIGQIEFKKYLKELQIENDLIAEGLCQNNVRNPSYIRALYYKKLCN